MQSVIQGPKSTQEILRHLMSAKTEVPDRVAIGYGKAPLIVTGTMTDNTAGNVDVTGAAAEDQRLQDAGWSGANPAGILDIRAIAIRLVKNSSMTEADYRDLKRECYLLHDPSGRSGTYYESVAQVVGTDAPFVAISTTTSTGGVATVNDFAEAVPSPLILWGGGREVDLELDTFGLFWDTAVNVGANVDFEMLIWGHYRAKVLAAAQTPDIPCDDGDANKRAADNQRIVRALSIPLGF